MKQPSHVSPPEVRTDTIPPFPNHRLQGASKAHVPSAPEKTTFYTMTHQRAALLFPEPNTMRMDYRVQSRYTLNRPLRFITRSGHWTGKGVQGYPWMYASVSGRRLTARVHGRPFWDGTQRAFSIDLGRELPVGTQLELITQTLFVDEAGGFEPYLAHTSPAGLDSLELVAAFKEPPSRVVYYSRPLDGSVSTPIILEQMVFHSMPAYRVQLVPCHAGIHCLAW